jgi:hypothetical protein
MTDQPTTQPTNVIEALARVQLEIGGIAKLSPAERQRLGLGGGEKGITYAYRGIDQISAAAQPLFGQFGIVIVPMLQSSDVEQITVNERPWTDTTVRVQWNIFGPGGKDDAIVAITEGQGRDNSDKGINKAMTGAYKNLLLRLLCIGDPSDDPDNERHELQPWKDPDPTVPDNQEAAALIDRLRAVAAADPQAGAALKEWAAGEGNLLTYNAFCASDAWLLKVTEYLNGSATSAVALDLPGLVNLLLEAPVDETAPDMEAAATEVKQARTKKEKTDG